MIKLDKIFAAIVVTTLLFAQTVFAETMYVGVLVVDVRSEPNSSAQIVGHANTSDPLEIIEKQQSFIKVRTTDGKVGWIKRQYAISEHPKSMVNERLEKEIAQLKEENKDVEAFKKKLLGDMDAETKKHEEALKQLEKELRTAEAELSKTAAELSKLEKKHEKLLQTAKSAVQITEERDSQKAELEALSEKIRIVENENTRLKRTEAIKWVIAGAGIMTVGFIFGVFARRKKGRFSTYG